jgi:hypothetical protein
VGAGEGAQAKMDDPGLQFVPLQEGLLASTGSQ